MVYLQTAQPFLWEGVPQRDVFYAEVGSVFNKAVGDTVVVVGATGSDALYFGCIGVGHVNIGKYLVAHFGVVHGDLGNAGSFFQQVAVTHGIGEGAANQVDSLIAHRAVQEDVEVKSFIRKVVVEAEREFGCRIAEERAVFLINYTVVVAVFIDVVTYPDARFADGLVLRDGYLDAVARFVEQEVAVGTFLVEISFFLEHTDYFIAVELPDRFAHHGVGQCFRTVDSRNSG